MDIDRAIEAEKESCKSAIALLNKLRDYADRLSFVNNDDAYFNTTSYDDNLSLLHNLKKDFGTYELKHYYMNGNSLALVYGFDKFEAMLFCADAEYALQCISGGKCHIVEAVEKGKRVVCDIQ